MADIADIEPVAEVPIRTIYPTNTNKYYGYIKNHNGKFKAIVKENPKLAIQISKTFLTHSEALTFIINKNIELMLPIKNLITEYADHLKVELIPEKIMPCDKDDLDTVQQYCWLS